MQRRHTEENHLLQMTGKIFEKPILNKANHL